MPRITGWRKYSESERNITYVTCNDGHHVFVTKTAKSMLHFMKDKKWHVRHGDVLLGYADTKKEAREIAVKYMKKHPMRCKRQRK